MPLCIALVTHAVAKRQSSQIYKHLNLCTCALSRRPCSLHAHMSFNTAVQLYPCTYAGALVLQASAHLKMTAGLYDPLCSLFVTRGRTKLK